MTKLTETQTIILTAGAQRPDNIALPLPKGLIRNYLCDVMTLPAGG
ncbi:hypothetical protein [Cypionkella sp.]|jgi:hypothetical protein|nr:hypothetical protein [Cypionkella sp.]MDO8986040.1 hypothetical protein [Cypionkella sp.]MDP1577770.1 hypothetical protein [Cypionkella sp.]MDP2051957.1 hypothetical protein [Cypionkella sp.]